MSDKEPELPVVGYWIEFSDGQEEAIRASFVEDVGKNSDLIKDELVKRRKLLQILVEEYRCHVRLAESTADQGGLKDELYYEQGALVALAELAERLFGWGEDEAVEKLRAEVADE